MHSFTFFKPQEKFYNNNNLMTIHKTMNDRKYHLFIYSHHYIYHRCYLFYLLSISFDLFISPPRIIIIIVNRNIKIYTHDAQVKSQIIINVNDVQKVQHNYR